MILLVEDDDNDMALMLRILQKQVPEDCIKTVRDGEAALQRITVRLADGDTIGAGNVKVKEWQFDREGYPDNGRWPQIQGEASAGAGGGLYFFAQDVYSLFQGDSDENARYVVRWSAEQRIYIFDEKLSPAGGGEHALFTGDMMHHPCQIAKPEWVTPFDADSPAACATRKQFLERYVDTPVLVLGTHFANPVGGRIVRDGDTYRFDI